MNRPARPRKHLAAPWTAALLLILAATPSALAKANQHLSHPDGWYRSDEGRHIAGNILAHQSDLGGWPKNVDTTKPYTGTNREKDLAPTFDNGATTDELRFLARAFRATSDATYKTAFLKGYDYILKAQYPTGGWPQFYPPDQAYHRHITFNDNAMVRLMEFLRETYTSDGYDFLDADRKRAARAEFDRGIGCILKCQIKVDGRLTVWCAQHDEKDYSPRPARTFELVSFSGSESVGITRLLMSLDDPSPDVIRAVQGAVAWFESAKLTGIKIVTHPDPTSPKGFNREVVEDPAAPPLWARFYDIKTNKPFFCDRDGIPKPRLADIGSERRNGYAWYGTWPQALLDREYPAWRAKWADRIAALEKGSPAR
jgi:PelA/Pel-15E family pectate lyase